MGSGKLRCDGGGDDASPRSHFATIKELARNLSQAVAFQSQTSTRLRRKKPANRWSLPLRSLVSLKKLQAIRPTVGSAGTRRSHLRSKKCVTVFPHFPQYLAAGRGNLLPLEEPKRDEQRTISE